MSDRIPRNLAAGSKPRFYIARKVIPWESDDPQYEVATNLRSSWAHSMEELIPAIERLLAKDATVTNVVEVRPVKDTIEEYAYLWVVHSLPVREPCSHPEFGTW